MKKKSKKEVNHEKMGQAYLEMSNINLTISQEFFHLEEEGEKAYEMDTKKAEGEAE